MAEWKLSFSLIGWLGVALARAAPEVSVSAPTTWLGMCDASAGVALGTNHFAVANDEDNAIRIFQLDRPGRPVQSVELSRFLGVDPAKPETDLEGAAWLGDTIFWIGSHGQNREGKFRTSRHRLFATRVEGGPGGPRLVPVGRPYSGLLLDLLRDARLRPFRLAASLSLPPKAPGALNIEGLCAAGTNLWIGFRNPIPQGRALVVPLLNPFEVIRGQTARLGAPMLLDLGGRGIRDLGYWQGQYVIIAGSFDGRGQAHLYWWDGQAAAAPQRIKHPALKELTPEAVVVYPDRADGFQLLSDDGTRLIGGVCCKALPDPSLKQFRSVWVQRIPP